MALGFPHELAESSTVTRTWISVILEVWCSGTPRAIPGGPGRGSGMSRAVIWTKYGGSLVQVGPNVETGTSSPTVAMFCGSDSRPKPFLSLMCHFEWWPCVLNSLKKTYTSMEMWWNVLDLFMNWLCRVMASVWYHKWPNWYSHVMMVKWW